MIFGAYYYVTAKNTSEAKAQANDFFNLIRATSFNARPAMDFEDFSGMEREDINEIGLTFLEELERLTKITPMIYTDASSAETMRVMHFQNIRCGLPITANAMNSRLILPSGRAGRDFSIQIPVRFRGFPAT